MRYNETENTVLAGIFKSGDIVTIKIINMETDELEELNSDICVESSHIAGSFLWSVTNMTNAPSLYYKNFMYEMSNGVTKFYGKFIYGGIIQDRIKNIEDKDYGLSIEQHNKLMSIINYDDKQLKNLAYAILGD